LWFLVNFSICLDFYSFKGMEAGMGEGVMRGGALGGEVGCD